MINRTHFFDTARLSLGSFNQSQVDGFNILMDEWEKEDRLLTQLAYVLATVWHESAHRMQPIHELGGEAYLKSKKYYPYYGRDLVQTTWDFNYKKVKEFSGIDVVNHPDLIGQMPLAAQVAITFMIHGWYTGKKLSDYINLTKTDFVGARRIINGKDQAAKIAGIADIMLTALR